AFGGEIEDRVGLVFGQQAVQQPAVADVALDEDVVRVPLQWFQRVPVSGVGEQVQVDHAHAAGNRVQHEVRADESGAAGDEPGGPGHLQILVVGSRAALRRHPGDDLVRILDVAGL